MAIYLGVSLLADGTLKVESEDVGKVMLNGVTVYGEVLPTPPVFVGNIPGLDLDIDVAMTPVDYSTYFTGAVTYALVGSVAGLALDVNTGILSGTPTVAATTPLVVSATNPDGVASSNTFNCVVNTVQEELEAPRINFINAFGLGPMTGAPDAIPDSTVQMTWDSFDLDMVAGETRHYGMPVPPGCDALAMMHSASHWGSIGVLRTEPTYDGQANPPLPTSGWGAPDNGPLYSGSWGASVHRSYGLYSVDAPISDYTTGTLQLTYYVGPTQADADAFNAWKNAGVP